MSSEVHALETLLGACRAAPGATLSHTSLRGGRYWVPYHLSDAFMSAYCACADALSDRLCLVESHLTVGPVVVDIDLRQSSPSRAYSFADVSSLVTAMRAELSLLVRLDGDVRVDTSCYVLEKPSPRPCKGGVSSYKDGFHLVFPGVVTRPEVQFALRSLSLPHVSSLFASNPSFTNSSEDMHDPLVIRTNAWMMYGSKKPDEPSPWRLTSVLVGGEDPILWRAAGAGGLSEYATPGALARLLSVRSDAVVRAPLTDAGACAVAALVASMHAAAERAFVSPSDHPSGPSGSVDASRLASLVALLSPDRASPYDSWLKVGMALHHETCGSSSGLSLWKSFSLQCPEKFQASDHEQRWRGFARQGSGDSSSGISISTLCMFAKADSSSGFHAWSSSRRREYASATVLTESPLPNCLRDKQMALLDALRLQFPELGLGDHSFRVVRHDGDSLAFEDTAIGLTGVVDAPRPGYWGNTVRVKVDNAAERFLGLLQGGVPMRGPVSDLHQNIPSGAEKFVFTHPDEDKAVLQSVTPNLEAKITLHNPREENSNIVITVPGVKDRTVAGKGKIKSIKDRMCAAMEKYDTLNLFVNNNTINVVNVTTAGADDVRSFTKLQKAISTVAVASRLRKLGDRVWRPVPGCPCAYVEAETFREFLNLTLNHEATYHERPSLQRELIEYLTNYDPPWMRNVVFDRGMISFCDGVLLTPPDRLEFRFLSYGDPACEGGIPTSLVARHHIDLPYAPATSATPLFDSVLSHQFPPDVSRTLMTCLGRLLFPTGTHDNWQVFPWLIGFGGTGKSLVISVAAAMFAEAHLGTVCSTFEERFGLDGLYDKHVLLGRDLPQAMSSVLPQEVLQSMVSGESVSVARKGFRALPNVRWTVPMLFASNAMPNYSDNAGQIVRRIVPFLFRKRVDAADTTLLARILASELPAILSKCLAAYMDAVREHREAEFWSWCPASLNVAQKEVGVATSHVRRFLSLGPEDEDAVVGFEAVYTVRDPEAGTAVAAFQSAYSGYMKERHASVRSPEVLDKKTLEMLGFVVEEKNVCKACLGWVMSPRKCCSAYARLNRKKILVAVGLLLVRKCLDDAEDDDALSS